MSSNSRSSIVSARGNLPQPISGNRTKKRSLVHPRVSFRDSVPSPTGLTGSPLRAFWLSYLRCALFRRTPKGVTPSVLPLTRSETPHARLVEQALTGLPPDTFLRTQPRSLRALNGLNPQCGITPASLPESPTWTTTSNCRVEGREEAKRLTPLTQQDNGLSPSPPFGLHPAGAAKRHWIEPGDCSFRDELVLIFEGLYFREPPSSTDKPLSRHPALRVQLHLT
jgi:hypothetical protein